MTFVGTSKKTDTDDSNLVEILKQGAAVWNAWRDENPFKEIDLSRSNLRDIDLSRTNLFRAYLIEADLSEVNLSGANLIGANLVRANLIGANLSEANLSEAEFSEANLSNADISRANLFRANLITTILSKARLNGSNLIEANLSGANLIKASLIGANLFRAKLFRASFSLSNLVEANFSEANLIEASFRKAKLFLSNFMGGTLIQANLSGADLSGANLSGANLGGANLSGACIKDWKISNSTKLSDARCNLVFIDFELTDKGIKFQQRQPTEGKFAPGEFARWYQLYSKGFDEQRTVSVGVNFKGQHFRVAGVSEFIWAISTALESEPGIEKVEVISQREGSLLFDLGAVVDEWADKSIVGKLLQTLFGTLLGSEQRSTQMRKTEAETALLELEKLKKEKELASSLTNEEEKQRKQLELEEYKLKIEKLKLDLEQQKVSIDRDRIQQVKEAAEVMQSLAEMAQRGAENSNAESITVEVDGVEIATFSEGKFQLSSSANPALPPEAET
jgi:uncharacterized protein YjbI with pentapeptide repeats